MKLEVEKDEILDRYLCYNDRCKNYGGLLLPHFIDTSIERCTICGAEVKYGQQNTIFEYTTNDPLTLEGVIRRC